MFVICIKNIYYEIIVALLYKHDVLKNRNCQSYFFLN